MSTLQLLLAFTLSVIQITTSQNITKSVSDLSDELQSLFCDGLSVGDRKCNDGSYGIQDFVDSLSTYFDSEIQNASTITQTIIDNLNNKLNLRASFLTNLTAKLQSTCTQYGYSNYDSDESVPKFTDLKFSGNADRAANLPSNMAYNSVYGDYVSLSSSTYKIPNNVDYDDEVIQKDARLSALLDETMLSLHAKYCVDSNGNEEYCNMYFGSINGIFRQFPGTESSKTTAGTYSSYDPRFRPWYVSAATGRKDVVILLDKSGSMGNQNRMALAIDAVVSVLKTLGQSSFVSVVAFSSDVEFSCFGTELVPATSRNVAKLISFVQTRTASGSTNFEAAFKSAFTILESGAKSCQTSILFLTDGESDDPSSIIESRNTVDINAVVFSYTLGADAATGIPRKVAALTNGVYTHIEDGDSNILTKMSSYYLYYAYGAHDDDIIITSPYLDFDTGVALVTMAMPVYVQDTYFVGVVGIDIPLSFLADAIGNVVIGRKSYSFVVNQESEAILHPLIPDPLTTLFAEGDEYNAVYINDLEPEEFDTSVFTTRSTGSVKIEATVKQPAGDVSYNGYIEETANLLYIYAAVGPSSLSIGIVIYTESAISKPNVKAFGLKGSPNTECDNSTLPSNCISPFILYDDLERMKVCSSDWFNASGIVDSSTLTGYDHLNGSYVSTKYPAWYLQAGGWSSSSDAIHTEPFCDALEALHKKTNKLGTVSNDELPFNGFRSEIASKILNSIYTMTAIGSFWESPYSEPDATYFSFYFATYQGLSVKYPASRYKKRTFNAVKRPWYQRGVSYPELFVFTTPYSDSSTGVLVASGATAIIAPNSEYPYGVAGFDYEFNEFLTYWDNIMSTTCDHDQNLYCYLIDSSAFLLWYKLIRGDLNDDDISRKFFGDIEPTLMQSLIDKEFFVNETNVNYLSETVDISYVANDDIIDSANLDFVSSSFGNNNGKYTVHKVLRTNLYVIYIEGYGVTSDYPDDCPSNTRCPNVQSPGCITVGSTDECKSAIIDVCIKADEPIIAADTSCTAEIDSFGICILKTDEESDLCAANFNIDDCGPDVAINVYPSSYTLLFAALLAIFASH